MSNDVRVLLAYSKALYREGLQETIGRWEGYAVAGSVSTGKDAIDFCRSTACPQLLVMDICPPSMDGIAVSQTVHRISRETNIVVIAESMEEKTLLCCLKNGVRGCFLPDISTLHFKSKIEGILEGDMFLAAPMASLLLKALNCKPGCSKVSPAVESSAFSDQDKAILDLVAKGFSNERIAETLFMSLGTVKKRLCAIMQALGCDNRVQLAVCAVRAGIVE